MSEAFLLAMLVERNDKIQRALQVLQGAQRYDYGSTTYMEAPLMPSESGDWIAVDDVAKAMQILQGECSE